jgi:L-threonylcarbamoyladenylate synthase
MSIISDCDTDTLKDAASSLLNGNLVAFPTETVYGLGADATNKDAVARLYSVKGRPVGHPLIVHISSLERLDKWASDIPEYAIKLAMNFWPGPMTLILPRTGLAKDFVTGGQDNIGIRVPSHKVAQALIKEFEDQGGFGVAAPSANRFGKVSPTTANAVVTELGKFLNSNDHIIDGGPCEIGIESTIIDCTRDVPKILRPGGITFKMIDKLLLMKIKTTEVITNNIKTSGLMNAHYAPNAKVYRTGTPKIGDGFIALSSVSTPDGAIRLASPKNNYEFAQVFYSALRLADHKFLKNVYVVPPIGEDIAVAINDRIFKATNANYS